MTDPLPAYPKRLIEVDLPIARISTHARREKSIRHGHISTLHIWWARRPLAACRAVICAALWPDPADPLCPNAFRETARRLMTTWAVNQGKHQGAESFPRFLKIQQKPTLLDDNHTLRQALLDFIADFANWDNSTVPAYLDTSRALTQAAHEALGGEPGTRPLVVDPFAGGGSIPLEALRVGADSFASDLNPVPVLLNKVVLEYIPKYGQRLADEVAKWGEWVKKETEKELAAFYPKSSDGGLPIAYIWARTILSEAPGKELPVEVPLFRSPWLAKDRNAPRSLQWLRDSTGQVKTEIARHSYANGKELRVLRPLFEIVERHSQRDIDPGTSRAGSATCPVTGYTTLVNSVRSQLSERNGGTDDARLMCVITTQSHSSGRTFRLSTESDLRAVQTASRELKKLLTAHQGSDSLIPDGKLNHLRGFFNVVLYGMGTWGDLFTLRQKLALVTLIRFVKQ